MHNQEGVQHTIIKFFFNQNVIAMKASVYFLMHQNLRKFFFVITLFCLIDIPSQAQVPLPIPFSENFESGQWSTNFATSNNLISIVKVSKKYGPLDQYHLLTYSAINGMTVTNHVDMHLNMTGANRDIFFRFFGKSLNQNSQPEVTLWFSDDGGNTYKKLISPIRPSRFVTIHNWQHGWKMYTVNMTDLIRPYGLTFTPHCVIRLVTKTWQMAPFGGYAFDNISVAEERVFETGELPERTLYYDLAELEFLDIIDCGRIDCPPPFFFDEGILDEDFWSTHPGNHGKAFLEKNEKGYHMRLSTAPNEAGNAVSAAAFRFDASPWAATDPDIDPAHPLTFSWKSDAESLNPYDAVYISDDGGDTYVKAYDFSENNHQLGEWQNISINLKEIAEKTGMEFSERFVVVFQHYTAAKAGSSGYAIDNVMLASTDPDVDPMHPKSFNYPNPFRSETNIQFEMSEASDVLLKILDSRGKVIYTSSEKNLPQGTHALQWDGKDNMNKTMPPGIYYYLLETAQGIERKRIWLEK